MKEIICLHIGQAGVQLSSTIWELFCAEHGVQSNGILTENAYEDENESFKSFFQEIPTGQYVPRAISIDFEPTVIDEIRSGPYRQLFHPDQLITGFEDSSNNYARGHFTLGKEYIEYSFNRIRKVVDMCENAQGFCIMNSYGGGTGSGFSSLLIERLSVEFTKKISFQVAVFPSDRLATATVESYNTLLCSTSGIDCADLCNFFDNESVFNICGNNLDIPRPTYSNLNRVIAQIISSMTASIRFHGTLNADLDQIITNLVPYPRVHFPIFTHAPILSAQKSSHQELSPGELTRSAFDPANQLVNVVMSEGKYMCCCLQFRGKVSPRQVNDALFEIKRRTDIKFVDWCPTGFKLGINSQPPTFIPRSEMGRTDSNVTLLSNSSAIAQKFLALAERFDILFHKRSFVHWYVGEGMEEMEFMKAREQMSLITSDYFEIDTGEDEPPPESNVREDEEQNENKEEEEKEEVVDEKEVSEKKEENSDWTDKEHNSESNRDS